MAAPASQELAEPANQEVAAPAEPAGGAVAELGSGQPAAQLSADAESIEIVFHSIVAQILRHNNVSEYKVSAPSIEKFL